MTIIAIEEHWSTPELGIGYLAEPYELQQGSGSWLRVRLSEVSTSEIRAKKDDWGDMTAPQIYCALPFPARDTMRPLLAAR
jgi:hypothetical protein